MAVPVSPSGIVQMVFTAQEDDQLISSSPEAMVISRYLSGEWRSCERPRSTEATSPERLYQAIHITPAS